MATAIYNVFTHYDISPLRIRATSKAHALKIGVAMRQQPQTVMTESACLGGMDGGDPVRVTVNPLETPYAVKARDQRSRTDN